MKNIIIIITILMGTGIAFVNAQDAHGLINIYNYSYMDPNMKVERYNLTKIDMNNNSKYEVLEFHLNMEIKDEADYTIITKLHSKNGFEIHKNFGEKLNIGKNIIKLDYNITPLKNGEYKLFIEIIKENSIVYRNYEFDKIEINDFEYELNPITVDFIEHEINENKIVFYLDTNNLSLESKEVYVYLVEGSNYLISKSYIENNQIEISYDMKELIKRNFKNPQLKKLYILTNNHIAYSTSINYEVELDFLIPQNYIDGGLIEIVNDENNLHKEIIFSSNVFINESSVYKLEMIIEDVFGDEIIKFTNDEYLFEGFNLVEFDINSRDIYKIQKNGPYIIKSIALYKENNIEDKIISVYESIEFFYENFEKSLLADLSLENINYDNESKIINFTIRNIGNSNTYSFLTKIFDGDFNEIGQYIVEPMTINEEKNFTFHIGNQSSIFIYADYNNEILKCNNYAFWPNNLEQCKEEIKDEKTNNGDDVEEDKDNGDNKINNEISNSNSNAGFNKNENTILQNLNDKIPIKTNVIGIVIDEKENTQNQKENFMSQVNELSNKEILNVDTDFKTQKTQQEKSQFRSNSIYEILIKIIIRILNSFYNIFQFI